jgi:hypothetical protein
LSSFACSFPSFTKSAADFGASVVSSVFAVSLFGSMARSASKSAIAASYFSIRDSAYPRSSKYSGCFASSSIAFV